MRAQRVLGGDGDMPWRAVDQALFEIEGALSDENSEDLAFLGDHRDYLLACQMRARELTQ
jgi:hypothetical protein